MTNVEVITGRKHDRSQVVPQPACGIFLCALVFLAAMVSCGSPGEPEADECGGTLAPAALITQSDSIRQTWRDSWEEYGQSLPPDSVVRLGVMFRSFPTDADRQLLAELDAVITYEFTIIPALSIEIRAEGIVVLARYERVTLLSVGHRYVPFPC